MAPALSAAGRVKENKESGRQRWGEQWMAIERPHTHTHTRTIQLVALRSSLKVVARLQICRIQFAHKLHTDSSWKENCWIKIKYLQTFGNSSTSGAELISIFGGKQKMRNQNEPLENSSTALEELAHYLWRFPSKKHTIDNRIECSYFEIAAQAPACNTHTETGRQSDRQVYILYRCLSVEHDDNDLASQWECECECEWMAGPKTADSRVPIWV